MNARRTNVMIAKYVLLVLIVISLLESIRLIWQSVLNYRHIRETSEDDFYTKDKGEGYYVKGWTISAITVISATDLVSLLAIWGIIRDMSTVSLIYGVYMSCISTYAAFDKYLTKSYVPFILPQIVSIVAILYACLNYVLKNKNPIQSDAIFEISKKQVTGYEPVKQNPQKETQEYED